jgi:hypothetical protein
LDKKIRRLLIFGAFRRVGDLPTRAQAEPPQNRTYVTLDGVLADLQSSGHLAIARAAPDQLSDLLFTTG